MEKVIWLYDYSLDAAYLERKGYFSHIMKEIDTLFPHGVMSYCDVMVSYLMTPHIKYLRVYEMPLELLERLKDRPFQSILYKAYMNQDLWYQRHPNSGMKY